MDMKGYTGVAADGAAIHYVDRKRWFWVLSVVYPLQVIIPVWLHAATGNELWFFLPFFVFFVLTPLLDWLIGEDTNNPPEEVVMQLEQDVYYRRLTYIIVPLHFLTLFGCAAYALTQPLSWWAFIAAGSCSGYDGRVSRSIPGTSWATRIQGWRRRWRNWCSLSPPTDTSRSTIIVAITCSFRRPGTKRVRGWARVSTSSRCAKFPACSAARGLSNASASHHANKPLWHYSNPILQSYAISARCRRRFLSRCSGGWPCRSCVIHHACAYWQLTSANYIEHYGLLREKTAKGRYERCEPQHSWNCNFVLSNLVLFHLERHSDHHTHPLRRYQSLRHFPDVPQLPNGYFGMYVLAYFPWLWFQVMDKRLMALPHVDGDLDKVNIDPVARPSIFLKWGRDKMSEPTFTDLPKL